MSDSVALRVTQLLDHAVLRSLLLISRTSSCEQGMVSEQFASVTNANVKTSDVKRYTSLIYVFYLSLPTPHVPKFAYNGTFVTIMRDYETFVVNFTGF